MQTFPMTAFTFEEKFPESSVRLNLGNSWTFTAPPNAPDQRIFILHFKGMKYHVDAEGNIDGTPEATLTNLKTLRDFYKTHRQYKQFTFNHPVEGALVCTFNKPLAIPKGVEGGLGTVEEFSLEFLEHPL